MLSGDTVVRGKLGWQKIRDRVTERQTFDFTDTCLYTFCLARGVSEKLWKVRASRPHQWPLLTGKSTWDLRIGDVVSPIQDDCGYSRAGWLHGFLYRQQHSSGWYTMEDAYFQRYKNRLTEASVETKTEDGHLRFRFENRPYRDLPNHWDALPFNSEYVGSFIRGFMDGARDSPQVATNDLATAEWLQLYAPFGGYIASGGISSSLKTNKAPLAAKSTFHNVYTFQMVRGDQHGGFRVRDISIVREAIPVSHVPTGEILCLEGGIAAYA